jgi:hypothetical protein
VSRQTFVKVPSIKFHENSSSGSRDDTCGQTDKTKLKVLFAIYDNAPKILKLIQDFTLSKLCFLNG